MSKISIYFVKFVQVPVIYPLDNDYYYPAVCGIQLEVNL